MVGMKRMRQRWIGALGVLAIVFAQLAVSAHACAMASMPEAAPAAAAGADNPCDRMDAAQRTMCERHCQDAPQAQGSAHAAAVDFVPAFVAHVAVVAPRVPAGRFGEPALVHATSPPQAIRHCRLLI
jgi:hypothetical protein